MNFSHLYSSALHQELGIEDSTQLFTDARRKQAINNGHLQFCDLTECAVRQSTITCSHGVREYNLLSTSVLANGDFLRLAKQMPEYSLTSSGASGITRVIAGEDLPRRNVEWLNQYDPGWRTSTGSDPAAFYERMDGGRRYFGLTPPPQIGSSESGTILLPYVAKPITLVDDTHVPFTFTDTNGATTRNDLEPYHQALVHYAAYELEKLRLQTEASQSQLQIFMGYVARFKEFMRPAGPQYIRLGRSAFNNARRGRWDDGSRRPEPWS